MIDNFSQLLDTRDLETGMNVLSYGGAIIVGLGWAAAGMMFSTVWVGAVIATIGAMITMALYGMGIAYFGFTHTAKVEAIGYPMNQAYDWVMNKISPNRGLA